MAKIACPKMSNARVSTRPMSRPTSSMETMLPKPRGEDSIPVCSAEEPYTFCIISGSSAVTERITPPTKTPRRLAVAKLRSLKIAIGRNGCSLVSECISENQSARKAMTASMTISEESNQP